MGVKKLTKNKANKKPEEKEGLEGIEVTKTAKSKLHLHLKLAGVVSGALLTLVILGLAGYLFFQNRIYPGVYAAGVNLAGLTTSQAQALLSQTLNQRLSQPLTFVFQSQTYQINLTSTGLNTTDLVSQAFDINHRFIDLPPTKLMAVNTNSTLDTQIKTIASSIDIPAIDSQLTTTDNQDINVSPSQTGQIVDQVRFRQEILNYINSGRLPENPTVPTKTALPNLSYPDGLAIKDSLMKLKADPLNLTYKDQHFTIDLPTALNLIDLKNTRSVLASAQLANGQQLTIESVSIGNQTLADTKLTFDPQKLQDYLATVATKIDRPVVEPLFNFDGSKVTEFQPPQPGLKLNTSQTALLINQALLPGNSTSNIELPVDVINPKNQLSNQLGIKELIGEGVSNFDHSIPNRIFNVTLAASRINGVLVAPGQTFSFDDTVGDISGASGYKQAYVIKDGRTVLDDGGGVCQVSTTLFRAVLNSGLPVVARTAHAYRVGYYEEGFPPGIDATVFSPSVDFKFKNDTPANILIQTKIVGLTLYVDFYGTSDGRVASVSTPIVTSQTPPPPDIRQDDPTLPKGTVKQVDFAAWGANVVFSRTVTRAGQVILKDTYHSNYRPWQAIYLVGTGA